MLYSEYLKNKFDYQIFGSEFLLEMKHCCLFYKPGKGKTYPCIDAMREVDKSKNGNAKVLVLSTADAIKNMWKAEIEPQNILPKNTILMSLSKAIQEKTKLELLKQKFDIIVIDECHKIKSHNTKSSKLVFALSKKCEYVWGLSGTPRGNSDIDIYCQFHNMCISEWGTINYTLFVNTCCEIDTKYFGGKQIQIPTRVNDKYRAGFERNVAMYSQRVGYTDEDNMPDLKTTIIKIPYKPTKEYIDAEDGFIQLSDYETTMTKLSAITKLHQIVNGYIYTYNDNFERSTYKITKGYTDKHLWILNNVKKGDTIVYRFEQDLQDLRFIIANKNLITTEIVEDYKNGKADVLLLQCSKCESFNLQMCKRMIFYTMDYSYIKYNQMLHRIWRMGQTDEVEIIILVYDMSVETKILDTVLNKEKLADLFMKIKGV